MQGDRQWNPELPTVIIYMRNGRFRLHERIPLKSNTEKVELICTVDVSITCDLYLLNLKAHHPMNNKMLRNIQVINRKFKTCNHPFGYHRHVIFRQSLSPG